MAENHLIGTSREIRTCVAGVECRTNVSVQFPTLIVPAASVIGIALSGMVVPLAVSGTCGPEYFAVAYAPNSKDPDAGSGHGIASSSYRGG